MKQPETLWVLWDVESIDGFVFLTVCNITNADRELLQQTHDDIGEYRLQILIISEMIEVLHIMMKIDYAVKVLPHIAVLYFYDRGEHLKNLHKYRSL